MTTTDARDTAPVQLGDDVCLLGVGQLRGVRRAGQHLLHLLPQDTRRKCARQSRAARTHRLPVTPGTLGTPGTPVTPGTPGTPVTPVTPDTPGTPATCIAYTDTPATCRAVGSWTTIRSSPAQET